MSIAETSLQAYIQKKEEGSLQGDRETVYEIIKNNQPVGLKEIASIMGKYPNQVSGRLTELRTDYDMIKISAVEEGERQYKVKQSDE